eukprot:217337_1
MSGQKRFTKLLNHLSQEPISNDLNHNYHLGSNVIKLNDGNIIPTIAIGTCIDRTSLKSHIDYSKLSQQQISTYNAEDKEDFESVKNAIDNALNHGYKHIDCAEIYRTEHVIGDVLNKYLSTKQLKRSDIWVTTKIYTNNILRNDAEIRAQIELSLKKLKLNYIDLFLIHSPHSLCAKGQRGQDVINIYKILHEYKNKGIIKSVGVSNFGIKH